MRELWAAYEANATCAPRAAATENAMKIDFGRGAHAESPQSAIGPFHKRIVRVRPIPGTRRGNLIDLECGHRAKAFGDLGSVNGVVLCTECRDRDDITRPAGIR